jgi:hypothetical protein
MMTFLYTLFLISVGYFIRWFEDQVNNAPLMPDDYDIEDNWLRDKREVSLGGDQP